jgi:dTDP-4-amino-4,6-dideoxygalactose transaminase
MTGTSVHNSAKDIPFLELTAQHVMLDDALTAVFRRALHSAAFVGGSEVTAFEKEFASFVGVGGAVGVNSGTDALRLAFIALGLQPGDEVITVSHTFIATSEAISQAGGAVRFVDVQADTLTMDPRAFEAAITPRTVGVVPVHLYGQPADMDPILEIARRHGLWVVEDAAQAHGATYRDRPAGSMGIMAAFSFYPGKNLGACGEAGATVGVHDAPLDVVRRLRDHGQSSKYFHDTEGYNGRLDAIQAGILRVKLRHLSQWNEDRRSAASLYREALAGISGIELPTEASYSRHVYHLFVIRAERRDALREHLSQQGIGTGLHYPLPLHLQRAYADRGFQRGDLPVTESAADEIVSVPMYPELTEAQIERVADAIRSFYGD